MIKVLKKIYECYLWLKPIIFCAIVIFAVNAGVIYLQHIADDTTNCKPNGLFYKTCTVHFEEGVNVSTMHRDTVRLLDTAKEGDKIIIYLIGNGGYSNSGRMVAEAMQNTKAHVKVIVEGDIYSAHALIASAAKDELDVHGNPIVMFHRSSSYGNKVCENVKGLNRTVERKIKCEQHMEADRIADLDISNRLIKPLLTKEQWNKFLRGHDIYLTGKQLKFAFSKK